MRPPGARLRGGTGAVPRGGRRGRDARHAGGMLGAAVTCGRFPTCPSLVGISGGRTALLRCSNPGSHLRAGDTRHRPRWKTWRLSPSKHVPSASPALAPLLTGI